MERFFSTVRLSRVPNPDLTDHNNGLSGHRCQWYVLRVTYQRELSTKEYLDKLHVENFVPVRVVRRRDSKGRFSRVREAAVHNYIFVRSTREVIDDLKTFRLPILRYVMHQQNGENQIMTVPESQMRNFIAVAANIDEPVIFLSPEEVALSKGDKVRIKDGVFMGVEGTFMRVKNTRDRRVVVKIDGITAVATASIPSALVEKYDPWPVNLQKELFRFR